MDQHSRYYRFEVVQRCRIGSAAQPGTGADGPQRRLFRHSRVGCCGPPLSLGVRPWRRFDADS